jgi:hypothetical protein
MSTQMKSPDTSSPAMPQPKPLSQSNTPSLSKLPKSGSAVILPPEACAVGQCGVIEKNNVRFYFERLAEHGPHAIQNSAFEYVTPDGRLVQTSLKRDVLDGDVEYGWITAELAEKMRQELRNNVKPFDPADFSTNPVQQVRFPAYLTPRLQSGQDQGKTTIAVAPFVACLSSDSLGNLTYHGEQRVDGFGKPTRLTDDTSPATAPIEGRVHIECRFLTWHYVNAPSQSSMCLKTQFAEHIIRGWPSAPTFQTTRGVDDPQGFYDLDRWCSAPSIHRELIPAALAEYWLWDFNANGTRKFQANAWVPNFNLAVEEAEGGAWTDAGIKTFASLAESSMYSEEIRHQPAIRVGFEYRVIGWKAKPLSED